MLAYADNYASLDGTDWRDTTYTSVTPWICEFRNVLVHSSAGIVCFGEIVVAETLLQTAEHLDHYVSLGDRIHLRARNSAEVMEGTYLSLLGGNNTNYYHWTLDCLGKLAAVDQGVIEECKGVLVPDLSKEFQITGLALTGLGETHTLHVVERDQTIAVERMIVPWSLIGYHVPHPILADFMTSLVRGKSRRMNGLPRYIYVDRRNSKYRRLANEEAVVQALRPLGFVAVDLDTIPLLDQVILFQSADVIVGPHGAGLTNLIFAEEGTWLIEIQMDSYLNWCFRRLAAVKRLRYDCVIGRQLTSDPRPPTGWVHSRTWAVSVMHLLGVVEQALVPAAVLH